MLPYNRHYVHSNEFCLRFRIRHMFVNRDDRLFCHSLLMRRRMYDTSKRASQRQDDIYTNTNPRNERTRKPAEETTMMTSEQESKRRQRRREGLRETRRRPDQAAKDRRDVRATTAYSVFGCAFD